MDQWQHHAVTVTTLCVRALAHADRVDHQGGYAPTDRLRPMWPRRGSALTTWAGPVRPKGKDYRGANTLRQPRGDVLRVTHNSRDAGRLPM